MTAETTDWANARLTFTKPFLATIEPPDEIGDAPDFSPPGDPDPEDMDHPVAFDPGDSFFVEVRDQPNHWDVNFLDTAMPLEYYEIPKEVVEVTPVKYYLGRVKFLKDFPVKILDAETVIHAGVEIAEAGVVDDGVGPIDLLLDTTVRPINRIKQIPRDHLALSELREEK